VHNIYDARTSETSNTVVLGNHEESNKTQEITINNTSSGELYDHNTMIENSCFSIITAENFLSDVDPMTMEECKQHSD
jgi:hypothetical protein